MTSTLTTIVITLNAVANAFGQCLAPIGWLPEGLSLTLVAVVTGIATLKMFKYTSNQRAIARVRREIRANLLAIKLFKENLPVTLAAQRKLLVAALRLLGLAVVPMAVMTVPMVFLLAQLAQWYQWAPIPVGGDTVITLRLAGEIRPSRPVVKLLPHDAIEDLSGPVSIASLQQVCWNVRAHQPGYHSLQFEAEGERYEKQIAIGDGVMRVSPQRPSRDWYEALLYPWEKPFDAQSRVQAISIEYPERDSWIAGTDSWIAYWFIVSLVAGFAFRGVFGVHL